MAEFRTEIVSRQEARARGLTRYFTGRPCKHGHIGPRWVKGAGCDACKAIEAKTPRFIARQKAYRENEANKLIGRGRSLKCAYGISLAEYDAMVSAQGNKCKICQSDFEGRGRISTAPAVDHCHSTGQIRGILCNGCNRGLGSFRDNAEALKRAAAYLARALS